MSIRAQQPALGEPRDGFLGRFRVIPEPAPPAERRLRLPLALMDRAARELAALGARFVDEFVMGPERSLVVVMAFRGELVALRAPLPAEGGVFASLGLALPAARWPERELHDLERVTPLAHPDLRAITRPDVDLLARTLDGPETFTIPYGPIRSGVFESVQFVIETGGEDVLALDVRPGFKRRGLEHRFEGLSLEHAGYLAERLAGPASIAHVLAFAQAVERALGVEPPLPARLWRTVHAELERVASHLDVAARLAEDCALFVGNARFGILKEQVMRVRAALCGNRFGRGVVTPGGVLGAPGLTLAELGRAVAELERELRRDRRLLLGTTSFTDRLIGSGRLDRATIEAFAGVGPVARAVGLSTDARFERPYAAYGRLGFEVVTRDGGDAMARLEVRLGEIGQSLHLLRQAIDRLAREPEQLLVPVPPGEGAAFGWAEAPHGELVWWVDVAKGDVRRVRVASASSRNWPLFAESFRGDVLTDFAFIEHSFGLTPAEVDR